MIKLPNGVLTSALVVMITKSDITGTFIARIQDLNIVVASKSLVGIFEELKDHVVRHPCSQGS